MPIILEFVVYLSISLPVSSTVQQQGFYTYAWGETSLIRPPKGQVPWPQKWGGQSAMLPQERGLRPFGALTKKPNCMDLIQVLDDIFIPDSSLALLGAVWAGLPQFTLYTQRDRWHPEREAMAECGSNETVSRGPLPVVHVAMGVDVETWM